MRYFFLAAAIVLVVAIVVPSIYSGLDVEGEGRNASPTLSTPPTLVPDASGSPGAARTPRPATSPTTGTALGQQVAARSGCTACHSINGTKLIGPTWKGLAGKNKTLQGGTIVLADEAYLRESIVAPNAKIVDGYQPSMMPLDFGTRLSADDISALVAYIQTLK